MTVEPPAHNQPPASPSRTVTRRALVGGAAAGLTIHRARARQAASDLRLLLGTSSVPGADEFTLSLATRWGEDHGIVIDCAFVPQVELEFRTDRVLRGGEDRDIVELRELQPFRHTTRLVDVSSLAGTIASTQGSYAAWAERTVRVGGTWFSLPIGAIPAAIIYRPSALAAAGVSRSEVFPDDWNGFFELAAALKAAGTPAGASLRQTPVAGTALPYTLMWTHGAAEVQQGSRSVSFASPELEDTLSTFATAWADGFHPDGAQWDERDLSNALIEGRIAMAIGGADAYLTLLSVGDTDIAVAPLPAGEEGRFFPIGSRSLGIASRSDAAETAMAFLGWWHDQAQVSQWVIARQGSLIPPLNGLLQAPTFTQDPNIRPFVDAVNDARVMGYSAAPSEASSSIAANYFVVNTFADVAKGVDIPTAMDRGQRLIEQFLTQPR